MIGIKENQKRNPPPLTPSQQMINEIMENKRKHDEDYERDYGKGLRCLSVHEWDDIDAAVERRLEVKRRNLHNNLSSFGGPA